MSLSVLEPKTVAALPPNGVWNKGTAPVDRFQALTQEMQQVEQDIFNTLNSKGQGSADQTIIQSVQKELEHLSSDIQSSMPTYPDPAGDIQPLINLSNNEGDNPQQWTITYSPASKNSSSPIDLVDYEGNVGGQGYSTNDHIANHLSSLSNSIQKIEKFVVKSLQDPLPFQEQTQRVDLFWEKKKSAILTNDFNQELSNLTSIADAAAAVKKDGIAETGTTQYTYYISLPVGKIMVPQPRTVINDFVKTANGEWQAAN